MTNVTRMLFAEIHQVLGHVDVMTISVGTELYAMVNRNSYLEFIYSTIVNVCVNIGCELVF